MRAAAGTRGQICAGGVVKSSLQESNPSQEDINSCLEDGELLLACGKKIPVVSSAAAEPSIKKNDNLPVTKGHVAGRSVDVLRDTGCSGVVVRKDLV